MMRFSDPFLLDLDNYVLFLYKLCRMRTEERGKNWRSKEFILKLLVRHYNSIWNLITKAYGWLDTIFYYFFFLHVWNHYSYCNAFFSRLLINTVKNLLWKLFSSFDIKLMVLFLYDILRQEFMWSWQIEGFIFSFSYWFNPSMCLPFI